MHVNTLALLTSIALARFALAAGGHDGDRNSPYHTSCSTQWGWSGHEWKTHWTTSYTPCTTTKTITSLVTSNLSTSTSTVTVPTSSGFQPVQSTLPQGSYSGSGGSDPVSKRDVGGEGSSRHVAGRSENTHITGVWCTQWRPGKCMQTTKTVHSTTVVSPVSTTTVYAACASNNLADAFGGAPITAIFPNGGASDTENTIEADSAYDCCVLAITTPNSAFFQYTPAAAGAAGSCGVYVLDASTTCAGQDTSLYDVVSDPGDAQITVGNSYCGNIQ
ncbi:hypothetical protein BDY17DRAFT_292309 [Neohortaea acidophila]|uniref:Uncharacterized protein n=1 Tax=Neohortaea acidophila TaxID=245834 RepID=A0A6A6Q4B0_9PEZI|nr:uncharacterized protein BDY17DRAFT_292309 [Neohortaea acidophila]KAF2486891.1 hypothetical protein BDY17DRAFT_292309 [Neohortaea acidophila]